MSDSQMVVLLIPQGILANSFLFGGGLGFSSSTFFEAGSLVCSCVYQASWPTSFQAFPSPSPSCFYCSGLVPRHGGGGGSLTLRTGWRHGMDRI